VNPGNVRFGPSDVVVDRRPDGTILVRSPHALGPYPETMTERLDHWAQHASYRTFLAERDAHGRWRNVTYAEAQYLARRIGQALLNRDLSVQNPIVILSGNDIEHALLGLAAMYAGIPYAPLSTDYSLNSTDFTELQNIFKLLTPGLIFVSDGAKFEPALRAAMPPNAELVVSENPLAGATMFADLVNTEPGESIDAARAHIHANTIFKLLFTAESAETPKGVIQTHRMWASNQEMARTYFAFLADEPPVMVDSLPWSSAIGGNAVFGAVLYSGGSLYIDHDTIHDLRVVAPTMYWNTPESLETLIPYLRDDATFRKHFFSRMKLLCFDRADLSREVRQALEQISARELGEPIAMMTGLGCAAASYHALFGVGIPPPGAELKLVPSGTNRLEARLRGPNVTLGYWRRLDLTRPGFDEEGFFKLGSCLRFADEDDPGKGFVFDGGL